MNPRCIFLSLVSLTLAIMAVAPVRGQIPTTTTPSCTPAMISSFTPCMNFVTNSSSNGTLAPTSDCCTSLRNLTNGGLGCVCLLVTGSVPFQIPINRTLAISLPRACNMPGVPLQCKASIAGAPAPGSSSFSPVASPESSPAPKGSSVPEAESPSLAPESDATPVLTPPSTTTTTSTPTSTTGSRSNVTPSSDAKPSFTFSPAVAMLVVSASALFYYHY